MQSLDRHAILWRNLYSSHPLLKAQNVQTVQLNENRNNKVEIESVTIKSNRKVNVCRKIDGSYFSMPIRIRRLVEDRDMITSLVSRFS